MERVVFRAPSGYTVVGLAVDGQRVTVVAELALATTAVGERLE